MSPAHHVHTRPCPPLWLLAIALLALLTPASPSRADERFDQAVRLIRRTNGPILDADSQLAVLALRQLKDPELTPLLTAWTQAKNPFVRINGILGLGDVSQSRKVDIWKLAQVTDPTALARALTEAIEADLIDADGLRQLAASPDVDFVVRSTLWIILASRGEPVTPEDIAPIIAPEVPQAARVGAALLLVHLGKPEGTEAILKELDELPPAFRESAVGALLETLWNYPLAGTSGWVEAQLARTDNTAPLRFAAIAALLRLNTPAGEARWIEAYANFPDSPGQRVRYVRALLDVAGDVNPATFAPAAADTVPLVAALGKMGQAIAAGGSGLDEALALVRLHHGAATDWIANYARDLTDAATAAKVLSAIIEDSMVDGPALDERVAAASLAADKLMSISSDGPVLVRNLLQTALQTQRRLTEEAILSGVLKSLNPLQLTLLDVAGSGPAPWSSTRAASLAILIRARYSPTLDPADLNALALVFQGAGNVSPVTETQAAWLFLKHTGQTGQALAAILADDDEPADAKSNTDGSPPDPARETPTDKTPSPDGSGKTQQEDGGGGG